MSETFQDLDKALDRGPNKFRLLPDNYPVHQAGGYALYCLPNGKWYVGVSRDVCTRMWDHQRCGNAHLPISKAIKSYGADKFIFIPLFYSHDASMTWLQENETRLIVSYDSTTKGNGYNVVTKLFGTYKEAGAYGPIHHASCIAAQNTPEALLRKSVHGKRHAASNPKVAAILAEGRKLGDQARNLRAAEQRADPVREAARIAKITATHNQPETKARTIAANREILSRPEVRAKLAAQTRARWARKRQAEMENQKQLSFTERGSEPT